MAATLLSLTRQLPIVEVDAGHVLLSEGERSGLLYVLADGQVEILKGDVQIELVTGPGALFGEIAALLDTAHMATVKAVTPTRLVRIEDAARFLRENPALATEVARLLAERLTNVVGYLADIKRQFAGRDHLGMVDEVLESLVHQQRQAFTPGSNREPDPAI